MAIITNKKGIDELFVKAVSSDYQYTDKQYSVTSILNSPRETILKRRHHNEIVKDVSEMVWLMFGTAFHEFMERQEEEFKEVNEITYEEYKDIVKEKKIVCDENQEMHYYIKPKLKEQHLVYKCKKSDYTLTGYSDLYDVLDQMVTDYKTGSVNKVLYDDWDNYIKQTKLYCAMITQMKLPCNIGRVTTLLKDWTISKMGGDYPAYPVHDFKIEYTYQQLLEEIEWVENYFINIAELEQLSDDELPICEEKDRTFGRKPSYAIMKNDNKRATKVCDSYQQACEYIRYNGLDSGKDKYTIVARPAEETKCMNYCEACGWCNHFGKNYATHELYDDSGKVKFYAKNETQAREMANMVYRDCKIREIKREDKSE